ncbi:hypothetical protein [Staphylococcus equorum]|uniref:hypothetical protein n=1 Tax=Staphylococcus equorum TaxID=246432 RepID=UPI0013EC98F5|nr:hypothetical protein [Staphylococcus equorum]QPT00913.1 hypothetical protein I6G41_03375 [Staphylococcus equorum]
MNRMIKYMASIAGSLHGIHTELIILNKSNPSQQAKKEDKPKNTRELDPKGFI